MAVTSAVPGSPAQATYHGPKVTPQKTEATVTPERQAELPARPAAQKKKKLGSTPEKREAPKVPGPLVGTAEAAPLLRFSEDAEGWLQVREEGLAALRALPAPVRVVAFLGRGRCGKSTTCGQLAKQPGEPEGLMRFRVGHESEPVTEGADVAAVPCGDGQGSVVFVDCEGSDNPLTRHTSHYHVLGLLAFALSSQVVHCEHGSVPERALEDLAATVAARQMLMTADAEQYKPDLCLLVIATRFKTSENELERMLADEKVEQSRQDVRKTISQAVRGRKLLSLPRLEDAGYASSLGALRKAIVAETRPVTTAGMALNGREVAEVVLELCDKVRRWSRDATFRAAIEPDSAFARVVRSRLEETARRLVQEHEEVMPPALDHWQDVVQDPAMAVSRTLACFDEETAAIASSLRLEVRGELEEQLHNVHYRRKKRNEELRASEERVASSTAGALRQAFAKALPALPLKQALPAAELEALGERRLELLAMYETQVKELRCFAVVERVCAELDQQLQELAEEVAEASATLTRQERGRRMARRRRWLLLGCVAAAGAALAAPQVPQEWRSAGGSLLLRTLQPGAARIPSEWLPAPLLRTLQPGAAWIPAEWLQLAAEEPMLQPAAADHAPPQEASEAQAAPLAAEAAPQAMPGAAAPEAAAPESTEALEATEAPAEPGAPATQAEAKAAEALGHLGAPEAPEELEAAEAPEATEVPESAEEAAAAAPQLQHGQDYAAGLMGRWRRPPQTGRRTLGALALSPEATPWVLAVLTLGALADIVLVCPSLQR